MRRALHIILAVSGSLPSLGQLIHEVRPVAIRPVGEDYAPVPLDSGFVMCSIRDNASLVAFVDERTGHPLSDLYWVPMKDGRPGTPILFSQNLCTPVNEGPSSFTDGGRTICYTRNQVVPKRLSNMRAANGQLGLFFSTRTEIGWAPPIAFEHNDPKSSALHPAFSADGMTLYFASDRPDGHGGMDLYRCQRMEDGWSAPVNLGPAVNGPHDEVYPRVQPDGTLHFSSNRPGGLGGLDIYSTREADGRWTAPDAMPVPVNSERNEHGYALMADGQHALMSSDRDGADAIYMAKLTIPRFTDCAPQKPNNYCYSLRKRPHAATASLPIDHYWDMGDGTRIKGYLAQHCYQRPGSYQVRSLLVDRKTGDVFHELSSQALMVEDLEQAWIAAEDTVRTGRRLELSGALSHVPGLTPGEYHWDLGDGSLGEGLRFIHAYKKPGVYEVKLDVLGKPGPDGRIAHRCNTRTVVVLDRFKDHEDQAVVATYQDAFGKTHTFEFQELPFDDVSLQGEALSDVRFSVQLFASKERVDLDDARFVEVRKHYRVIERFDPVARVYTYSVGEASNAEELYQIFKKVKELQFLDAEVFALRVEKLMDLSQLDLARLEDLNNRKLRTSAIHFAYKSASIESTSFPILDQIAATMRQHPELRLVIEAHTDDIGSRRYNLDLSQGRALSVMDYLVESGVVPTRMVPIGHGKHQPIASNKTEEGRAQNRRVEFRMVVKGEAPPMQDQLSGATQRKAQRR